MSSSTQLTSHPRPPSFKARQQALGIWVFGSALFLFYVAVFFLAPQVLPPFKQRMLGVFSALLAGMLGYFIAGSTLANIRLTLSQQNAVGLRTGGGLSAFALVLFWWTSGEAPIQTSPEALTTIVATLDSIASNLKTSLAPSQTERDARLSIPLKTRSLLKSLATNDENYSALLTVADSNSISTSTYLRLRGDLQPYLPTGPEPIRFDTLKHKPTSTKRTQSGSNSASPSPPKVTFLAPAPATPQQCTVYVSSIPTGATAYVEESAVGSTPTQISIPQASSKSLRLEKTGYEDAEATLNCGTPSVRLRLDRSLTTVTLAFDQSIFDGCISWVNLELGDHTVAARSNSFSVRDIALGSTEYSFSGQLACPSQTCRVSGDGTVNIRDRSRFTITGTGVSSSRCELQIE